jgi:hypothetical protein
MVLSVYIESPYLNIRQNQVKDIIDRKENAH